MKKITIPFLLILAINESNVISIDQKLMETLYDKAMLILEGMTNSTTKEKNCVVYLVQNKEIILNFSLQIIAAFQKDEDIINLIWNYIGNLPGESWNILVNHCHINEIIALYGRCMDDEERIKLIEDIGYATKSNVDLFYEGSSNFVKVRGLDGKLVLFGKVVSSFFNLTLT